MASSGTKKTALKPQRLAHLVLRVRDLKRTERFYTEVLGLHVTGHIPGRMVFFAASDESSHELAAQALGPDALGPEQDRVGLYHFAWKMGSVQELEVFYLHLKDNDACIVGIGDHGTSLGIYFLDPDGNEIEVFYELPREEWPHDDPIFRGKFPIEVNLE